MHPKGMIPRTWRRNTVPNGITVIQWITDFSLRVKQLQNVVQCTTQGGAKELKNLQVWLGGLFISEAYITATGQYEAQANSWSLEELYLDAGVDPDQATDTGATWSGSALIASEKHVTQMFHYLATLIY